MNFEIKWTKNLLGGEATGKQQPPVPVDRGPCFQLSFDWRLVDVNLMWWMSEDQISEIHNDEKLTLTIGNRYTHYGLYGMYEFQDQGIPKYVTLIMVYNGHLITAHWRDSRLFDIFLW